MKMLTWNDQCDLGLRNIATHPGLSVHPNPANGFAVVEGIYDGTVPEVYDITGRKLPLPITFTQHAANLDIHGLPPGNYLVRYKDEVVRMLVK
jgi:hypothetical protein